MEVIPGKTVLPIPDALSTAWMKEKSSDNIDAKGVSPFSLSPRDDRRMSAVAGIGTFCRLGGGGAEKLRQWRRNRGVAGSNSGLDSNLLHHAPSSPLLVLMCWAQCLVL